jgi:hypothetical protein
VVKVVKKFGATLRIFNKLATVKQLSNRRKSDPIWSPWVYAPSPFHSLGMEQKAIKTFNDFLITVAAASTANDGDSFLLRLLIKRINMTTML